MSVRTKPKKISKPLSEGSLSIDTTEVFAKIARAFAEGKRHIWLEGGTAASKCLGRGTRVVMADLTLKPVEDVEVGDTLMGIDGKPHRVVRLYQGQDELYRIKQARGIDYVVSSNHILSLRQNWREIRKSIPNPNGKTRQRRQYVRSDHTYEVVNIPLSEYLLKSNKWKRRHKGWKLEGIELKERKVAIEPYFVGLWLGDGTAGDTNVTNADNEVITYLKWFAIRNELNYSRIKSDPNGHTLTKTSGKTNPLRQALIQYGIFEDKRIPKQYLNNSRKVRLELLAGLIDSDGYKTRCDSIAITQVRKALAEDIALLTRSLGFYTTFHCYKARMKRKDGSVYETDCYRVDFVGNSMADIPLLLNRKRVVNKPLPRRYASTIQVEPCGYGDYFGFEIEGDHLFLLEDFTVTHNTWSVLQYLILLGRQIEAPLLTSVVSESRPHLKRGCLRDFQKIMGADFNLDRFNKTDLVYAFGQAELEFFSADEPSKQRGARRDILFINEINNIPYEAYRELDARTRLCTIADWNPVSEFFVHEQGLLRDPDSAYIHATYKDAIGFVPEEIIKNILKMGRRDPNWANVYLLGRLGKVEGLVYPYFDQETILPEGDCFYGLDFGFSTDVTALGRHVIVGDELHSQELIYEKGLTNDMIAHAMADLGIRRDYDEIFADAAEPKSIEEIARFGFNIKPAAKGPGSVEFGHQKIRQYKQYWTKDSLNGIKEQRNYRYIQDKDGKLTEKTTHNFSHLMDSRRYAIVGKLAYHGYAFDV